MQIIYATGEPGYLDFAIAEQRRAIPAAAKVFAICNGDRVVSELDERLFAAISYADYYDYMAVVREALEREKRRLHERNAATMVRALSKPALRSAQESSHPSHRRLEI